MTQREFYNAVIENNVTDAEIEYAKERIEKLDKRNATPSKAEKAKREENERIKGMIDAFLATVEAPVTAREVGVEVGVSTSRASALLGQMSLTVTEVKVDGRKVKGYSK